MAISSADADILVPRSAAQIIEEARLLVEPAYRAVIDALPAEIRHIAGYHIGWWDADGRPAIPSGKVIRPALTIACTRAAAAVARRAGADSGAFGEAVSAMGSPMVAAAVAVELVHDFSLLHDDVMDADMSRRHRPATWVVFGIDEAILNGDVLLTCAIQQLATHLDASICGTAVKVLAAAVLELCAGQSQDLAFAERDTAGLTECLAMAEAKTGALLGAACQLGALVAGADEHTAAAYREFGRQLGLAFQLVDDLLGIWGDEAVTGKPAGSDLVSRKKSLPVVAALSSGTSAAERLAWLYGREEELDENAVDRAATLIEQAGGKAWAVSEAKRRIYASLQALHRAGPDPAAVAELRTLAEFITGRDH